MRAFETIHLGHLGAWPVISYYKRLYADYKNSVLPVIWASQGETNVITIIVNAKVQASILMFVQSEYCPLFLNYNAAAKCCKSIILMSMFHIAFFSAHQCNNNSRLFADQNYCHNTTL